MVLLGLVVACDRGPTVKLEGDTAADRRRALANVEAQIRERYPQVTQASPAAVATSLRSKEPVVLVDVREPHEFAVARIASARRVSPAGTFDDVASVLGDDVRGSSVVFYCSVGERSSRMAQRVGRELVKAGASRVLNLEGGIFAWHNEGYALVDERGETPLVHPYDEAWGQLLIDRKNISKKPRTASP